MSENKTLTESEFNKIVETIRMNNPELHYSEVIAMVVEEHEIDLNDVNKLISKTLRDKLHHELVTRRLIDRDKTVIKSIALDI